MMGLLGKLAFWKKDDFDLGDLGPKGSDPFGSDPFKSDPFTPQGNDQFGSHDPYQDPFGGQANPRVNEIGMGAGGMAHGIESVHTRPTSDPYGSSFNSSPGMGKDIEIIAAKIDTIRVSMENLGHKIDILTQRVAAIEEIAKQEQQQQQW